MVAGDSISGVVYDVVVDYGYLIQPPVGQVWLITWITGSVTLTNGVVVYEEPGYREFEIEFSLTGLKDNTNCKLFIDNNLFLLARGEVTWSGVQFK